MSLRVDVIDGELLTRRLDADLESLHRGGKHRWVEVLLER